MLVLNLTEDFLHNVFQRNDSTSTSKLINDHGKRLLLLQEHLHKFAGSHRFGHKRHLLNVLQPFFRLTEHLRGMDIARDVVNILMIDNNLRLSAIHKDGHQVIQRTVVLYGLNLRSGYHTVAHLSVGKVQSILENLHFLVDIVLILSIINTRLHQIVEVHFRKCIVVFLLLYLKAKDAEDNPGKHRTETRNGPKHHIAEIGRYSKDSKQPVWIALEESLW